MGLPFLPVGRVLDQFDFAAGVPVVEHVGASPDRVAEKVEAKLLDRRRGNDMPSRGRGHVAEERARCFQSDGNGLVIGASHCCAGVVIHPGEGTRDLWIAHARNRGNYVVDRHRRAIGKGEPISQGVNVCDLVGLLERFGQKRLEATLWREPHQRLRNIADDWIGREVV